MFSAREVPQDFHARYSAQSKTYLYRIRNSPVESPFEAELAWRIAAPLDLAAMQRAAKDLLGCHDFSSFMSAGSTIAQRGGSTVRTVTSLEVRQNGTELQLVITADGYLYNMVRIIVGTLTEVGAHRMEQNALPAVLAACDRAQAGPTAPAKGLFLYHVEYGAALSMDLI
ncbi:MAG: tRNA pseudouridine synthase A [Ruthenibacterium sp.]